MTSELHDTMRSRRSIRRFKAEPPGRDLVRRLLEAAVTAPSASNKQPWRFLVVTNRGRLDRLARAVEEAVERVAAGVEPGFEDAVRAYGDFFSRFSAAPVVIVVLFRPLTLLSHLVAGRLDERDREAIRAMERASGLVSASLAIQNILLAAHDLGLGASCMTGPLLAPGAVREILAVPAGWEVAAFVPLGHPDEEPRAPGRKPVEKVTSWIE